MVRNVSLRSTWRLAFFRHSFVIRHSLFPTTLQLEASERWPSGSKGEALRPPDGEACSRFGRHPPLLGILELINDKETDNLAHFIRGIGIRQVGLAHGES